MDYLRFYNTIDSTNKEAHRLLAQGPVIQDLTLWAENQTEGRGQHGRTWVAEPGSHLAMTIIHQPTNLSPSDLPILNMEVSLGISKAIQKTHPNLNPLIKWPNDIYAGGKKLCGILIENSLSGQKVHHSIIGIGLNVNETDFPPEIPNAVSLYMLTGIKFDLLHVLNEIRSSVLTLLHDDVLAWKEDYDRHLFGLNEWFSFETKGGILHAEVCGISDQGKLILRTKDQKVTSYYSHEVRWVLPPDPLKGEE